MKFKAHILIFLTLLCYSALYAQNTKISGIVLDEDGNPIIGAGIISKEEKKGTISDFDGNFLLEASDKTKTIIVSSLGMKEETVEINGKNASNLRIILYYDKTILDQAVVTGYAQTTVKRIHSILITSSVPLALIIILPFSPSFS